jgi:DNA-directed RNA polymerase specialized sigma24 family protein
LQKVDFDSINIAVDTPAEELLALDDAIEMLAARDPLCAELVKLRFFAGLTLADAAVSLGLSKRTADRYWFFARAWLFKNLSDEDQKRT